MISKLGGDYRSEIETEPRAAVANNIIGHLEAVKAKTNELVDFVNAGDPNPGISDITLEGDVTGVGVVNDGEMTLTTTVKQSPITNGDLSGTIDIHGDTTDLRLVTGAFGVELIGSVLGSAILDADTAYVSISTTPLLHTNQMVGGLLTGSAQDLQFITWEANLLTLFLFSHTLTVTGPFTDNSVMLNMPRPVENPITMTTQLISGDVYVPFTLVASGAVIRARFDDSKYVPAKGDIVSFSGVGWEFK